MKSIHKYGTLQLLIIMILVSVGVAVGAISILYHVTLREKKEYLKKLSDNQVSIIRSVYHHTGDMGSVLAIIQEQKSMHPGLEETGEFTIGLQRHDTIFLLLHRDMINNPEPLQLTADPSISEPIRFALTNHPGYITGKDYRDHEVLAYCDYIPDLQWGTVTKIDFTEIRRPFYITSLYALGLTVILVLIGVIIFKRFSDPIISRIVNSEEKYRLLFDFMPIGITLTDQQGSIVEANQDSVKLLGIGKDEHQRRSIGDD